MVRRNAFRVECVGCTLCLGNAVRKTSRILALLLDVRHCPKAILLITPICTFLNLETQLNQINWFRCVTERW
jgi:hypothetical protein